MHAKIPGIQSEAGIFYVVDPERLKENNPLLSAIGSFVEEHIWLEPFEAKVRNDQGGAPAVHPKMMLKILFYSYASGVYSSREIEDRMSWDPHYIYLSADQRMDHSTLCAFILRYQTEIKDIFSKLLYVMSEMGYVGLDFVAVDGTKIKANASRDFTGTRKISGEKRKR